MMGFGIGYLRDLKSLLVASDFLSRAISKNSAAIYTIDKSCTWLSIANRSM